MSNVTRPSSSSNYDERFVVPLEASRRGAHRARVSPVMAALPVVAVIGIVVGAISLVYFLFGGLGGSDPGANATTVTSPTASSAPSDTATSSPSESAASPSESAPAGAGPGAVDKSITVDVFNGTSPTVSGIARKASTKITNAGWTTGRIETWTGTPVSVTTIYYPTADKKATAQAIAKALGRGSAKISPSKAGSGIAVVIGNDYPGAGGRSAGKTAGANSTRNAAKSTGAATKSSEAEPSQGAETPDPTASASPGN